MQRYVLVNNKVPYLKSLTNEFSDLFKSHYSFIQKRKFDDKLLSYSINSFLANSLYLIHCKSTVGILSMNRNKYTDLFVNGHKSKFRGSYRYSNLFWEMLEDLNFIRIARCKRSYTEVGKSYVTLLEPMISYLTPYLVNLRILPLSNCILLRDKYKNVLPYKKTKILAKALVR
ncbi:Uncharacterised protein [Pragia fontium]|nr:Uncharacterised protein [Pragia fontium]